MAVGIVTIAHIVAAVFAIIELGLTGYIASAFSPFWRLSVVSFMIFNSVWSLLVLLYVGVTPLYLTSIFHKLAALVLNVLTTLFWFAGSIALAVNLAGSVVAAAVAFGFFLWAIFTGLTVLDVLESLRSRGHNTGTTSHKAPSAHPGV